jgi:diaminopimelate decarboxylase
MASNYNYVARPPVIGVRDGATSVILRRETEQDLLALDTGVDAATDDGQTTGADAHE